MKNLINSDLKSFWDNNKIERAEKLNERLQGSYFQANAFPMHFTGNPKAKTILVMLNPGSHEPEYDFAKLDKHKYRNSEKFIEEYTNDRINFGEKDKARHDNFDLKQAAFLYSFDDTDLQIPREFWKSPELKLEAKRNVLMNKYQLELIPYISRSFGGLLDNKGQARSNFQAFEPFLTSILDEIFSEERRYVVFCSRQFSNLFTAASENSLWKNTFVSYSPKGIKEGKLTLNCSKVNINYKGKSLSAIIAHSFASQALPNAYEKMIHYGNYCFNEINS